MKEAEETKVIENEWNGKPMFSIFIVDEDGNKVPDFTGKTRPVLNMGIRKAQHLIVHLEELKAYVLENS